MSEKSFSFIQAHKTQKIAEVNVPSDGMTKTFYVRSDSDFIRLSCAIRSIVGTLTWTVTEYYKSDGFQETLLYTSGPITAPEICETQVRSGQLRIDITCTGETDFELVGFANNDNAGSIEGAVEAGIEAATVVTNPTITNLSIPLADTEVSFALPSGTKQFKLQARNQSRIQISYVSGDSGTLYYTMRPGAQHFENNIKDTAALTLYIQSSKATEILEILSWS